MPMEERHNVWDSMEERHYVWDGIEERHNIWDGMGSGIMYGGAALCMVPYGAAAKKAGE